MEKAFIKSMTIRGVALACAPSIVTAILTPTPETIGAAVVSVLGLFFGVKGRVRLGGLKKHGRS